MESLTLTKEQLVALESFIQDMPVKYGLPLLQFFDSVAKSQEKTKEEDPPNKE